MGFIAWLLSSGLLSEAGKALLSLIHGLLPYL